LKTLGRIVLIVAIIGAIYFATIGSNQFYRILDTISDVIQAVADNYTKK